MVEKLKAFYLKHGLKIMLAGFSLSAVGILLYIKMQHGNPACRKIGFAMVVAGLIFYVIGRVGVVLERRAARMEQEKRQVQAGDDEEDDEEDNEEDKLK